MGLLDSVIGALAGQQQQGGEALGGLGGNAQLLQVVLSMLAGSGSGSGGGASAGLGGLVEQFQRGGMGDIIGSWISSGQNLPISADQLGGVLGPDVLSQIAQQLGVSQGQAAEQMSQVLPQVVDQLTPEGRVPEGGLGSMAEILGRFR